MQAIRPDYFHEFKSVVKAVEESKHPEIEEEKLLHKLAQSDGWPIFEEYVKTLKTQVQALSKTAMESGVGYEEIGKNAVISELVVKYLDLALQRVRDAYESVESAGDK